MPVSMSAHLSSPSLSLPVRQYRLQNGATLLYRSLPGAPRTAVSIYTPGGNRLEPIPGLVDFVDRLLMKGTKRRSQEDISIAIDSLTLEVDTDTKRDYSLMGATFLEEDLDAAFELMADLLLNPTFAELDREKEKVAGEVMMDLDSPRSRAADLLVRTLFEQTSYAAVGSIIHDHIEQIQLPLLQAHHQMTYQPERLIFSIASHQAEPDVFIQLIERYFVRNQAEQPAIQDAAAAVITAKTLVTPQTVTFARDDSSQAHIFKGWFAPDSLHPDYVPLVVLNTILGAGGLSTRLFLELRDKQGLAYHVRSSYEAYQYKGMFSLYIGTEPKNKEKCLKGFEVECQKLIDIPVSAEELTEAKQNILGKRAIVLETASQQANYVGAQYTLGRSLEAINALPQQIQAVTAADVQRVAQSYLAQPAVTCVVGPSAIL